MKAAQQSSVSLLAACDQFYLDCEARNLSPRTVGYYQEKLPVFVDWLASEGITKAHQLQPEHIRKNNQDANVVGGDLGCDASQ